MNPYDAWGYYGFGVFSKRVPSHPFASFITEADARLFAESLNERYDNTDYEWRAL